MNVSKTIVVTGASRGIGYQLCLLFCRQGHQVVGLARNVQNLERLAGECGAGFIPLVGDINKPEHLAAAVAKKVEGIDILIHNAAAFVKLDFTEVRLHDLQDTYHSNVFAPYLLTQKLLPHLRPGAHVLAISSVGGLGGSMKFKGLSVYSSSKGALNILVECLAEELRDRQIFVNALALGSCSTEMFRAAFPDMEAACTPQDMAVYIAQFAHGAVPLINGKVLPVSSQNP